MLELIIDLIPAIVPIILGIMVISEPTYQWLRNILARIYGSRTEVSHKFRMLFGLSLIVGGALMFITSTILYLYK